MTRRRIRRRLQIAHVAVPAAALALLILSTACSTADDSAANAPASIDVTAVDYAFAGLPATASAGTSFTLANNSEGEVHELVAIRLPDDETRTVAELVTSPSDLAAYFPTVATVLVAPPGQGSIAVEGDGSLTEPGRYAIICAIPTGADPAEYLAAAAEAEGGPPDVAGGPPHFAVGMYAEITIVE